MASPTFDDSMFDAAIFDGRGTDGPPAANGALTFRRLGPARVEVVGLDVPGQRTVLYRAPRRTQRGPIRI